MVDGINGVIEHSLITANARLADELKAIKSIYDESTMTITSFCDGSAAVSLKHLELDHSFTYSIPSGISR